MYQQCCLDCSQEWDLYSYILPDTVLTTIMQKDLWSEIPESFLNVVLFILMLQSVVGLTLR